MAIVKGTINDDSLTSPDSVNTTLSGGVGDDRYVVSGRGTVNYTVTIEDAIGAADTLDASGASKGVSINLNEGQTSTIDQSTVVMAAGGRTSLPLDVLFLQDLSGSFSEDVDKVTKLVPNLVSAIQTVQIDAKFGVASFVDKPIGSFGGTGDYVYRTDLTLTNSTSLLGTTIGGLDIRDGNDGPEAQIEALMQAALRTTEVGYRTDALRAVVLMTDADYHKAGDGVSAGISTSNNGDVVLDGATPGTEEDYPDLTQVREALQDNSILPIFAVTSDQLETYQDLVTQLGFGAVVQLSTDSSNLASALTTGLTTVTKTQIEDAVGSAFADTLIGNGVANKLLGNAGNDTLTGHAGNDSLTGGNGKDVFVYQTTDDSGVDTITDFASGDVIRVEGAKFRGFSSTSDASTLASNGIALSSAGGITTLAIGTDASTGEDLTIQLNGTFTTSQLYAFGTDIGFNSAPTGSVTITGLAEQGQTLTASNNLSDADGLGTISYQWLRGGSVISGATASTYTLAAADVAQAISVQASYTDGVGKLESVTSATTTPTGVATVGLAFTDIGDLRIAEGGDPNSKVPKTDTFQVALTSAPRHNVIVTLTVSDTTEGLFTNAAGQRGKAIQLTFTPDNWDTPKTVTVTGVDDKPNDGNVAFTISTSTQSDDLRYDGMRSGSGLNVPTVTVLTIDDDEPDEQYGDASGAATSDLIDGSNGASDLYGLSGRDEMYGNNGDDRLYGGYGDDVLFGNADDDELEGDQGNDKLDGGTGNDSLNGGTGNDSLYGQAGNDNLLGEAGKDSLLGGAGNDTLNGGADADNMDGGNGADVYYIDNAADVVRDSGTDAAVDTVYIMSYLSGGITLGTGIDNGTLNDLAGKGSLTGNNGNNALTGNAEENVIFGGEGTDTLSGGEGGDTLDGGVGNDTIDGGVGTDSLTGGAGGDSLSGGLGDDVLYSGEGDDVVDAGDGADLIIGGDGAGNDKYNGGGGIDSVKYTSATAGITVDLVKGTATSTAGKDAAKIGTDTLSGIENVIAGNYNDIVKGSKVANVLTGGLGSDSLYGGAGDKVKDVFDFNAIAESKTGSARDKVYDFVSKIDKVDLGGIDANTATAKTGDQAFAFSGSTAKANSVWYTVADVDGDKLNDDLVIYGDVNGNTTADFEIGLVGVTAVVAADFVL